MMCWCSYPDLKPPSPVISSFGAFSGYKINFAKSEVSSGYNCSLSISWSPTGFTYLYKGFSLLSAVQAQLCPSFRFN